jgi:hypothetical protein
VFAGTSTTFIRLSTCRCGESFHDTQISVVAEEFHRTIAHHKHGSVPARRATELCGISSGTPISGCRIDYDCPDRQNMNISGPVTQPKSFGIEHGTRLRRIQGVGNRAGIPASADPIHMLLSNAARN